VNSSTTLRTTEEDGLKRLCRDGLFLQNEYYFCNFSWKMPKKSFKKNISEPKSRTLEQKEDGTEYAVVQKALGSSRFLVKLNLSTKEIVASLRGKFRKGGQKKKNMVEVGTVVLVGIRDFQPDTVDIIHVYTPEEARSLKKQGVLVEEVENSEQVVAPQDDDIPFDFEEI